MATRYKVIGATVMVKTITAQGPRILTFLEGALLPEDVSAESIDHHLDVQLIAPVTSPEAIAAGPSGQQPQGDLTETAPPVPTAADKAAAKKAAADKAAAE